MDELTSLHLRHTAAWCTQQLSAGFAMRAAALRPDLLTSDDPLTQLNAIHDHQELLPTTVNYICKQRQQIIEATGISLPEMTLASSSVAFTARASTQIRALRPQNHHAGFSTTAIFPAGIHGLRTNRQTG